MVASERPKLSTNFAGEPNSTMLETPRFYPYHRGLGDCNVTSSQHTLYEKQVRLSYFLAIKKASKAATGTYEFRQNNSFIVHS